MLETVTIPILVKAIDFLFGEGSKILQERRERRLAQDNKPKDEKETNTVTLSTKEKVIQSKDVVLSEPVLEHEWLNSKARVEHLLKLLEIHTRNYYLHKEQYAMWGRGLAPAIVVHNLDESENEIAKTTKELQEILKKVYGKKIVADEVEQA
jgi:hypothetical protein